jgi:hypothetical protein
MKKIVVAGISILALTACTQTPTVQLGPNAEVTFDGLHRVDNTQSQVVYVKPSIDLSQYEKIMLVGLGIQYRDVDPRNKYKRGADEFSLTEAQKASINEVVRETMIEEIAMSKSFELVSEPGRGVLLVRIGLSDVVSRVPPSRGARNEYYLTNIGEALLVMEYSDFRTNEVLARVADRQAIEPDVVTHSNAATNRSELKRLIRKWGKRIRDGIDELHALGCYACE